MHPQLSICLFVPGGSIAQSLEQYLEGGRYRSIWLDSPPKFLSFVEANSEQIDCLIVLDDPCLPPLFDRLYAGGILLPTVLVSGPPVPSFRTDLYHSAVVRLEAAAIEAGATAATIDRAIAEFLHLGPSCSLSDSPASHPPILSVERQQSFLLLQQRRLAEKLKERLGYLGVYYKRNPDSFYRNLPASEKSELLDQLDADYRAIILNYFSQDPEINLNEAIDRFVNRAFFADISAAQILEIHMELMDEFSQQLKIEGRSEEILLDYRLTLIDILAHLGEMYRRSIPREDIPLDLLA